MDDFTTHVDSFEEALKNLTKVLQRCKYYNLALSNEKCYVMMQDGMVLGHHVSQKGIQVDLMKIEVIKNLLVPTKQKDVRCFVGHVGYYRRFIKEFSKIASHLFVLPTKDVVFVWT